jgi:hypothetical protein
MNSSLVSTALRPSFGILRTVTRSRSIGAKNSVIPSVRFGLSSRGDVRHRMISRSASWALVIQTFFPEIDQPPSTFFAKVEMVEVSVPASGSVTANETWRSPSTSRGRNRFFRSALPCLMIDSNPKIPMWTALHPFIPAPEGATSRSTIAASVTPRPPPPYSAGTVSPSQPPSTTAL